MNKQTINYNKHGVMWGGGDVRVIFYKNLLNSFFFLKLYLISINPLQLILKSKSINKIKDTFPSFHI